MSYCNRVCIPSRFRYNGPEHFGVTSLTFQGPRSRDVINQVTNRFAIDHFLLVLHWYQVSISKRFRDIRPEKKPVRTDRQTPQVILYSGPCNVLHWTDNNNNRLPAASMRMMVRRRATLEGVVNVDAVADSIVVIVVFVVDSQSPNRHITGTYHYSRSRFLAAVFTV